MRKIVRRILSKENEEKETYTIVSTSKNLDSADCYHSGIYLPRNMYVVMLGSELSDVFVVVVVVV